MASVLASDDLSNTTYDASVQVTLKCRRYIVHTGALLRKLRNHLMEGAHREWRARSRLRKEREQVLGNCLADQFKPAFSRIFQDADGAREVQQYARDVSTAG